MQNLVKPMAKLFHPSNRKWTVPLTVLVAVVLVGGVAYYGGFLKNLFKGARASDVYTWNLNNSSDYLASNGITFGPNNASVDLEFTSLGLSSLTPNITDLWYNGSNILGAAIDADNVVAYSISDGPWGALPINFGSSGGAAQGIRIKRIADGGAFNYVFGLGTTAQSGSNPGSAAVVYGTMSPSSLGALNYISLPMASSFTAGTGYQTRLYGGLAPKTSTDPNLVSVAQDLTDPIFMTIGNPGQISSINNFLVVGGRLYATVTDTALASGSPRIWVTTNGTNWSEAFMDPSDPSTTHTGTYSIVSDTEGFIYVTTNAGYILKSTLPAGDVFKKITLPAGSSSNGLIYADDANNIWLPLTDGGVLRSVDYQGGLGATNFFRMNTEINFSGGNTLRIEDAIKISSGKIIWAGGLWQNSTFISGTGWSSRTASNQFIVNKTGVEFFNLEGFSTIVPPVTSNNEFKYRISNFSASGPWYYFNATSFPPGWIESAEYALANTADEVDTYISQFKADVGYDDAHNTFYFQAVYTQPVEDLASYDVILRSINLTYVRPEPTLVVEVDPFIEKGVIFDFTVTAQDPDGAPISDFTQPLILRSGIMGIDPPTYEDLGDTLLTGCVDGGWISGVKTYTGCHVDTADNDNDRWIGVGYWDLDLDKAITGYDTTRIVDVTILPVDNFTVTLQTNPPVNPDEEFGITAEARVAVQYGSLIKTNFGDNPGEFCDVALQGGPGGAIITPNTLGDGVDTGVWTNGVASYDHYSIDTVGSYQIVVSYLSAIGRHPITIQDALVPYITELKPPNGPAAGGNEVNIVGGNFGSSTTLKSAVHFGAIIAPIISWEDSAIRVTAPAGDPETGVLVTVTNDNGTSNGMPYLYDALPVPHIDSLDPDHGPAAGGNPVTITGTGFGGTEGSVDFGSTAAHITSWSDTEILATAPAGDPETGVLVTVTNDDGTSNGMPYGYDALPDAPIIYSLNPDQGPVSGGTLVAITGENLSANTGEVYFGANAATIIYWSDTLIRTFSPVSTMGAGIVQVHVTRNDGLASGDLPYEYLDVVSSAKAVRYYSPNYLVTELSSLYSIAILAEDYPVNGGNGVVEVALGLFDATGTPVFTGDDGLDTGYFVMTDNNADNLDKLISISADPAFTNVRMLRFRIYLYTPDISLTIIDQPWVESIALGYTLVEGQIGVITFDVTETTPYEKYLPNDTDTPISYNLIATSNLTASDPTFQNMRIGISWPDPTKQPPVGLHAWIEVIPGSVNNIIATFGPGDVVPFKVFFSTGTGVYLSEGSYPFQITGRLVSNSSITLASSPEGTILTGPPIVPSFELSVVDDKKVVVQGGTVNFNIEVTGVNGFVGDVELETDVTFHFDSGRIASTEIEPFPVHVSGSDPSPATLTLQIADLTSTDPHYDINKWVTFAIYIGDYGGSGVLDKSVDVQLYILSEDVPDGEFVLITTDPTDQNAQPNSQVVYGVEVVYSPTFPTSNAVTLSTPDLATKFTDVTGEFDHATLYPNSGITSAQLTLTVSADPTPLDTATTFTITGTSDTIPAIVVDAAPIPVLTIVSTIADTITISLTMPTEDIPNETLPSLFTLNLYPAGAATKDDYDLSLTNLAPTSVIDQIITIDILVAKDLLTDGATYTVYARSTRHFWTKADNDGQVAIDLDQTTPHLVSFPQMTAGDIYPDNLINSIDVGYAVNQWFKSYPDDPDPAFLICDMNNDNYINSIDVGLLVSNWFLIGDPFFN